LAVSRPIMLTLIVGGSLVAGSDNPHRGTLMPLGPSTPSVGLSFGSVQKLVGFGGHRYDRSGDVDLGVVNALGIAIGDCPEIGGIMPPAQIPGLDW
jgi:hypothetical protein